MHAASVHRHLGDAGAHAGRRDAGHDRGRLRSVTTACRAGGRNGNGGGGEEEPVAHRKALTYGSLEERSQVGLRVPERAVTNVSTATPAPPRLKWWQEIAAILAFYWLYSAVRNLNGPSPSDALRNAHRLIRLEQAVNVFHERAVQDAFDGSTFFIQCWNVFYGTAHFFVTAGVLAWLFFRQPDRYRRWRWVLATTTALALVGFIGFPLAPPRLLFESGDSYGFVDTLQRFGGLWSFESGPVARLSNQYTAMPSLHFAWSAWCTLALWPGLRRWWSRAIAVLHPLATTFAIVVTGNHYILDAAGGAVALAVGTALGTVLNTQWNRWRQPTSPDVAGTA